MGSITQSLGNVFGAVRGYLRASDLGHSITQPQSNPTHGILSKSLAGVPSNKSNSADSQGNASIQERITLEMASPAGFIADDVIKLVEAAVQAYTTGSATYTPDPISAPVAGKTLTLSPSIPLTFK